MKYIFIIYLILPLFTFSQDCKLNKQTDPYTKETKLSTGFIELYKGSVTIDADSKEIDVFFAIEGNDKCFDNSSTAAIFFEGTKTKMTTRNSGSMNCEGFFHFNFKNSATTISQVMGKRKLKSFLAQSNSRS